MPYPSGTVFLDTKYGVQAMLRAVCLVFFLASSANAGDVAYRFEWQGSGGYSIRGAMSFDVALLGRKLVREDDLSCFQITGYLGEEQIGRWALGNLTLDTTWTLTFSPSAEAFEVYSEVHPMPQAWNMDGYGENCGTPGFGFNIGNAAQDICVDGQLVVESQMPPPTPFPVQRVQSVKFASDACRPEVLLSRL